jgi:hypothetical protein
MGSNFLAIAVGALAAGQLYTKVVYDYFERAGTPERVWYVLAGHTVLGAFVFWGFMKLAGEFEQQAA